MATAAATLADEVHVTRCAWCARYLVGTRWLDEETVHAFARPGAWNTAMASHGICPGCIADLRRRGLSR